MAPKYAVGQQVKVTPNQEPLTSPRDTSIKEYAGQIGEVTNHYWISSNTGEVFYIYTVRMGATQNEIVLHEDELTIAAAKH